MLRIFASGGELTAPAREDPLDCLLCSSSVGRPTWDSPFGRGRPGWAIECARPSLDHLGSPIDAQGAAAATACVSHHEMKGASEAWSPRPIMGNSRRTLRRWCAST